MVIYRVSQNNSAIVHKGAERTGWGEQNSSILVCNIRDHYKNID